jgi:ribonuclease-3
MSSEVAKKAVDITEQFELTPEGRINPFNKNNEPVTKNWIENLLKRYGIFQNINNLEIYQQALVHTSYTIPYIKEVCIRDKVEIINNPDGCMLLQEASYERLEFLGDTLLDAVIGAYLYKRFPDGDEAFLSTMKKKLISRWVVGDLAKICDLPKYMIVSKTLDDKFNARNDIKKCCDLLEALLGAIYLDFGKYEYVERFMINLIEHPDTLFDMTSYITDGDNAKTKLRNYVRRVEHCDARYEVEDMFDEDPEQLYTTEETRYKCSVYLKRKLIASVVGSNPKALEFAVAEKALVKLGITNE